MLLIRSRFSMKKIQLTIAYDGTDYNGWQRQKNGCGIEEIVERTCTEIFQQEVRIIGASRTDAGVHAWGQVATISVDTTIPTDRIPYALNSRLPEDIVIRKAQVRKMEFHPRYDAVKKTYSYAIYNGAFMDPKKRKYMAFESKSLNLEAMKKAACNFIGEHDFKGFCSTGSSVKSTVRTIFECSIKKESNTIEIIVTGNGFLYNMVRIIAGTLIEVGKGKIPAQHIQEIIKSKNRDLAGKTAPAKGLTLVTIYYEKSPSIVQRDINRKVLLI